MPIRHFCVWPRQLLLGTHTHTHTWKPLGQAGGLLWAANPCQSINTGLSTVSMKPMTSIWGQGWGEREDEGGGVGSLLEQESEVYFGSKERRIKMKRKRVRPRRISMAVCMRKGGGSAAACYLENMVYHHP